jgi:hypothetical protein
VAIAGRSRSSQVVETNVTLQVIGAGVGRTGTYSLKLAINQLGLGPTHHMDEVINHMPAQLPLWQAALSGKPDWPSIFEEYRSAVDWPTAGFWRELFAANPSARFILTHRSPESWAESFSATIYRLISTPEKAPEKMRPWIEMARGVVGRTGFPLGLDNAGLAAAFNAHLAAVRDVIPASQLLVYQVKEGWEPLCEFLGIPVPDAPFPHTNGRNEFWDRIAGAA